MATNPMQRKSRISFLLGMLLMLVIAAVIVVGLCSEIKEHYHVNAECYKLDVCNEDEIKEYWKNREYFERILSVPPYYEKDNPDKAITWFKDNAEGNDIFNQMNFYIKMARKYNLVLYKSETEEIPGEIIYEDEFQIAVKNYRNENIRRYELS